MLSVDSVDACTGKELLGREKSALGISDFRYEVVAASHSWFLCKLNKCSVYPILTYPVVIAGLAFFLENVL